MQFSFSFANCCTVLFSSFPENPDYQQQQILWAVTAAGVAGGHSHIVPFAAIVPSAGLCKTWLPLNSPGSGWRRLAFEEWLLRNVLAGTASALEKEGVDNTPSCFPAYLGGLPGGSGPRGGLTDFMFKLGFPSVYLFNSERFV